jgi:uncharacterized protein YkwD
LNRLKTVIKNNKILISSFLVLLLLVGLIAGLITYSVASIEGTNNQADVYIELTDSEGITKVDINAQGQYSFKSDYIKLHIVDSLLLKSLGTLEFDYEITMLSDLKGFIYIESRNPGYLIEMNGLIYELSGDFKAIYDSENSLLHILSGTLSEVEGDTVYQSGNTILFEDKVIVSVTDREIFSSEYYSELLQSIGDLEELNDLIPPKIISITHSDGYSTQEKILQFGGEVEPNSSVKINNESVEIDENGIFSLSIDLIEGENEIIISVSDDYGNITTEIVKVVYEVPVVESQSQKSIPVLTQPVPSTPTQPINSSCSATFNQQMLGLINAHRQSNGKSQLTLNSAMNQAACNHSTWMSQNNSLSHTGVNGTQPWDRCRIAGTSCTSENVAMHSSPSAQILFNMWKNSPTHNANMLGNFSTIGIGISGLYATTVFN